MLEKAVEMINGGTISLAVINKDEIVHTEYGRGVSPLLNIFNTQPEILKSAFVVDKIIGKAAAMILVAGGVSRAYGLVMSAAGREYLEKHGILADYTELVDIISNRDGTDMCPIEKSIIDIDDAAEGLKIISATIDKLRKNPTI